MAHYRGGYLHGEAFLNLIEDEDVLTKLKRVDGLNSGLDADLFQGSKTILDSHVDPDSKLNNRIDNEICVDDHGAKGDGVTDDSAAIKAAIEYAISVSGTGKDIARTPSAVVTFSPGKTYYVGTKVQWPSSYRNLTLDFKGARLVTDLDGAMLQAGEDALFDQATSVVGYTTGYRLTVRNGIFQNTNGASTSSCALAVALSVGALIERCWFVNFWVSLDGVAFGDAIVRDNRFQLDYGRTAQSYCHFRLRGAPRDSGQSPRSSFGVQFHGNEVLGYGTDRTLLQHGIVINNCDGLTYGSNHISFYSGNALRIEPLNDGINIFVTSIMSAGGNYFDDPGVGSTHVGIVGTVQYFGSGDPRNCLLQNIKFADDYFRGDGKADYAINVNVTDAGGYETQYGGVKGIIIKDCFFRTLRGSAIGMAGQDALRLPAYRPIIQGNRFDSGREGATSSGRSYLSIDAKGWHITDNVFLRESTQATVSVFLDARTYGAVSGMFSNNDLGDVNASTAPLEIRADSTAQLQNGPNILPSGVAPSGDIRAIAGGTANAITLTASAGLNNYVVGMRLRFRASASNTGATTLSLNGGTAQPCTTVRATALPSGYIRTDRDTIAEWTGGSWRLYRDEEVSESSGVHTVRHADGTQIVTIPNLVPDWTLSTVQSFTFPTAFSETPAGGIQGIRSGAATALANFESIRSHGPSSPTGYFLQLDGTGTNGSGAEYTLTAMFIGKWY